jgi:NAD-dependent DNA ligase
MNSEYGRIIGAQTNAMRHSLGALVGIAQGLLCDGVLSDVEIQYLRNWFTQNEQLAYAFPGDVIYDRVKEALTDGIIADGERTYLITVLRDLVGRPDQDLADRTRVTELAYDSVERVEFPGKKFCVTGDFIHGPRKLCESEIAQRNGLVAKSVTKKLDYLVIGKLGSIEWKNGSFGIKIEMAKKYKKTGCPILIVSEECWIASLKSTPQ